MPMDVDNVVALKYVERLQQLVSDLPYMRKEEICDDIIEFVEKMEEKYKTKGE
jgi:hypothetical protein